MMWRQNYQPILGSLLASAVVAVLPLVVLAYTLGVRRTASWKASLYGLVATIAIASLVYGMPAPLVVRSVIYGAAFGLFPIGWIVFAAILLFDVVVASGRLQDIRWSLAEVSPDPRIQALLIAFAFGAFIEGASGAGTPVAVSASLLAGLGFPPLLAGGLCLLANTAPVAYGALGLPILTLNVVTGLPVMSLSAAVGRICPIIGLVIPAYLIFVLAGRRGAQEVWPALVVCGVAFAVSQFLISNLVGPSLADIFSAIAAMLALTGLLRVWRPPVAFRFREDPASANAHVAAAAAQSSGGAFRAWMPYLLLVVVVLVWGAAPVQQWFDRATLTFTVPGLHNAVERVPPVVPAGAGYPAVFVFNWVGATGTACFVTALLAAALAGIGLKSAVRLTASTARRLVFAELTIALLMAIAFVMNYAGMTATLGLGLAASGSLFPFFSAYVGWLGVFLTGSDTSSNALFGNLQVVSARALGLNPILTTAVNTCGGVMGKMISVVSIAVAAAATGMAAEEEGKLFRFTLWHSVVLTGVVGLLALTYAYLLPGWMPVP